MGDGLLTADLDTPIAANAQALGAPRIQPVRQTSVAVPKNPENNVSISQPKPMPWETAMPAIRQNMALAFNQIKRGESNNSDDMTLQNIDSATGQANSTAQGPTQMLKGTGVAAARKYFPAETQGKSDTQIQAMLVDQDFNTKVSNANMWDNVQALVKNKIPPTPVNLALAWRTGPQGATNVLRAAATNPNARAGDVAPDLQGPGNGGAANLTVAQLAANPYARGPGAQDGNTPQQMFTLAKGNQILAQMLDETTEAKARIAAIDKNYKPLEYPKPPTPPQPDPLKTFSSVAGLFATIAAGFSRTPAIAAMNGLAGAMNAAQKSDWETYQAQYQQFKDMSAQALAAHEQHSKDLNEALEVMSKNAAAGTALLSALAALSHDDQLYHHIQLQDYLAIQNRKDQLDETARKWALEQPTYEATVTLTAAMHNRDAALKAGDPDAIRQADALVQQAESQLAGVKRSMAGGAGVAGLSNPVAVQVDGKPAMAVYNKQSRSWETPEGVPIKGDVVPAKEVRDELKAAENAPITDEAANYVAGRVLAGDERATVGMARSNANMTKVANAIVRQAREQGIGPGDLAVKIAQFQGTVQAERTLGQRTVAMEVPANEVDYMAPLALEASDKVDRTQYPDLNAIILAGERRTGSTEVVQFGLATNSLIYTYAKFLNPTGIPTDQDKARATDILSTAWSKGQFQAAIDQIRREITSGQTAVQKTRGELAGGLTSQTGSAAPRSFKSESDVERAAAAGEIKSGDKVIVNGRPATWH